ncbi:MAG: hypothetical protein U0Q19_20490 [Kineosporiaceae bacterium]
MPTTTTSSRVADLSQPLPYPDADYFSLTPYTDEYTFGGQRAELTYWHRPL